MSSNNEVLNVVLMYPPSQEKIMEMECELLTSSFKDLKTVALMKENMGRISDGSSSYRAGALQLGFKKAFELKKQKRQPPGVLLRCTRYGCTRNTTPVSYSLVGGNIHCTNCQSRYGNYYMQCTGCSYNRVNGNYVLCNSCGKKFV